uniref:high choriolytic enzyme 1-like n=1 Tax=Ciona intestinalis TaxID=7719 RepID=UPI00089DA972
MILNCVLSLFCLDLLLTFTAITGLPIDISVNQDQQCSFNTTECTDDCGPLGHQTDEWDCPISCECKSSGFIEGDIKFDKQNIQLIKKAYGIPSTIKARGATSLNIDLWTNRVNGRVKVPFVMRNDTSNKSETAIYEAVAAISGSTCIDFINRTTEVDFIEVIPGTGCWSYVGIEFGKQELSIGPGCEYSGIVQHEFLHALGFWHEQSRPDRDDYVTIRWENIKDGKAKNFRKRTTINSLGSPYDTQSIMHYSGLSFSKNGSATIVNKTSNKPIRAQRLSLSPEDIYQVNALYCNPVMTGTSTIKTDLNVHTTNEPPTTDSNVHTTNEPP